MPGTAASCGSASASSLRLPRSLPYDVEFSLTSSSSRTPCSASQAASATRSGTGRDTNAPRKAGIAQNVHLRSQPDAILSGATTPPPSLRRSTRGPDAGATPGGRSGISVPAPAATAGPAPADVAAFGAPGAAVATVPCPARWRDGQQAPAIAGGVRGPVLPREHRIEARPDLAVIVKAEDLRFGQRLGEAGAVPLGQAARRDHLRAGRRGAEQFVDGLLLGRLDEPSGIDQDHSRVFLIGQRPARRLQPGRQLL